LLLTESEKYWRQQLSYSSVFSSFSFSATEFS
jgi:hypothetical protein